MSTFEIDFNSRNPGQFFACCGLLEMAERMWPGSEGEFLGSNSFRVTTPGSESDPLNEIVQKVATAAPLVGRTEDSSAFENKEAKGATRYNIVPLLLLPSEPYSIRIDWWLKSSGAAQRSISLWSGQQVLWAPMSETDKTKEDKGTIIVLQNALRQTFSKNKTGRDLLSFTYPASSRVGVDPTSSVKAIDAGFSPNEQSITVQTSPATEIFALIGFQGFRPLRNGEEFVYTLWSRRLPTIIARAAAGGAFGDKTSFKFKLAVRGECKSFGYAVPNTDEEETHNVHRQ